MRRGYLVALVGPCGSGKSTVARLLGEEGIPAREVSQEHTSMPYYFLECMPRAVIYLDVRLDDVRRRKGAPDWPADRLTHQKALLSYARHRADLYFDTTSRTPPEIIEEIASWLEEPEPEIIRVPQEAPTIQEAVDQSPDGATIAVSPGEYRENVLIEERHLSVTAVAPRGRGETGAAVIRAAEPGSTVLIRGGQVLLSGLVLTGGTGAVNYGHLEGGGLTVLGGATARVYRCRLWENTSAADGGGLLAEDSLVIVRGCRITENSAQGEGGGLALVTRHGVPTAADEGSAFMAPVRAYDEGYSGGGEAGSELRGEGERPPVSAPRIPPVSLVSGCVVSQNRAEGSGGGIYVGGCSPRIESNQITHNRAEERGGGLMLDDGSRSTASGNLLEGNTAGLEGGGVCLGWGSAPAVEANTLEGNSALRGGAAFIWANSSGRFRRNRLKGNRSDDGAELVDLSPPPGPGERPS